MIPFAATALSFATKGVFFLLKNPKLMLYGAVGLTLGFMYLKMQWMENRLEAARLEAANLRVTVALMEEQIKIGKEVDKINSERIKEQELSNAELEKTLATIESAPESSNGQLAPVLEQEMKRHMSDE